ncbi:MAG: FliM/FliN family flagellar motor switch protein [Hoeflea sp. D1-CHI-28]
MQTTAQSELHGADLIDEIIRLSDFNFQRLPMLEIIGERFVENLSVALPEHTRVICEASLAQFEYMPLAQIIDALPTPPMIATCSGSLLDGDFMMITDPQLALTFVELSLGGTAEGALGDVPKAYTGIECGFGGQLARILLRELQSSMSVIGPMELELENIETDPEAANIAPQASLCVRFKISVAMAGRTGALYVVLPYDTLEPIRANLAKVHFGDGGNGDRGWQKLISGQLERAHLNLEVILAEQSVSLDRLMRLKPGDVLEIYGSEDSDALVRCEGTPVFRATTGKRNNGHAAVQITKMLELPEGEVE